MARILIAEDEDALRALCARALASEGHEVKSACDGSEALGLAQQFVQRLLRPGADLGNTHGWRHLEQNVPRMYEIAALEFPRMALVIAPAFTLSWCRRNNLASEQLFDRLIDFCFIRPSRIEQSDRNCTLPEKFARGGQFVSYLRTDVDLDAINGNDAHDRTGSFARVCGVRTI